jgi:hypothetical protein
MPPRRVDPLGLWLCALAVLGLARSWLYLVRDAASAGAIGWIWLAGSALMAGIGAALLWRGFAARPGPRPRPRR